MLKLTLTMAVALLWNVTARAQNTNKCLVHIDAFDGKLLVTSCIDNLLKGAVGQAVQNMNIMFGIDETAGLRLKASAF